jgi:hypothetical protein
VKKPLISIIMDKKIILQGTTEKLDMMALLNLVTNIWVEYNQGIIGHTSDYQFLKEVPMPYLHLV